MIDVRVFVRGHQVPSRGLWATDNNVAPWVKLDGRSPTNILATDLDVNGKDDVVNGSRGVDDDATLDDGATIKIE